MTYREVYFKQISLHQNQDGFSRLAALSERGEIWITDLDGQWRQVPGPSEYVYPDPTPEPTNGAPRGES